MELINEKIAKEIYDGIDLACRHKVLELFEGYTEEETSNITKISYSDKYWIIEELLILKNNGVSIDSKSDYLFNECLKYLCEPDKKDMDKEYVAFYWKIQELRYKKGTNDSLPTLYFLCRNCRHGPTVLFKVFVDYRKSSILKAYQIGGEDNEDDPELEEFRKATIIHLTKEDRLKLDILSLNLFTIGGVKEV